MGILTSQNPDTPEGLEQRLSIRIHRIPSELLHSSKLEPRNPDRPEGFRQRFHTRATTRTPDQSGGPLVLRASPLSQQGYAYLLH
jgi:hypothetical protein